jgi:hypothetical protein
MKKVVEKRKDIVFFIKMYPIRMTTIGEVAAIDLRANKISLKLREIKDLINISIEPGTVIIKDKMEKSFTDIKIGENVTVKHMMHKGAYEKAKVIVCEKSLTLLEDVFAKKTIPPPKCETTAIDENIELAEKLGISGTPAIILPNGTLVPGYKEADALIALIDKFS